MASRAVKYGSDEYEISYEVVNPKCKKVVLFLHGWGANKEIMKKAFARRYQPSLKALDMAVLEVLRLYRQSYVLR